MFNAPICSLDLDPISRSDPVDSAPHTIDFSIGLSVSDLTRLVDHSIWNNAVVVQPFELVCFHGHILSYQEHLKSEFIKFEFRLSNVDPEVVANIPVVPVNFDPRTPGLPDCVNWLSPFWDTCLQRMTEYLPKS